MASAASQPRPVVLVTGASRGLGLCIAQLLLRGTSALPAAHVVTLSRSRTPELEQLLAGDGSAAGQLAVVQGDVTSEADNERAVKAAVDRWGRLDAVVFNAGIIEFARLGEVVSARSGVGRSSDEPLLCGVDGWKGTPCLPELAVLPDSLYAHMPVSPQSPDSFAQQIAINVSSLVTTLHYALPYLRASPTGCGKAVFVSSGAATSGRASWGAYNAGKAAMNGIARTLASEEDRVAVWAVQPGVVATEMQRDIREKARGKMTDADHQRFVDMHSQGQLLPPEKPAHVLAALAIRGTRDEPAGLGRSGAFLKWEADELKDFQLPG